MYEIKWHSKIFHISYKKRKKRNELHHVTFQQKRQLMKRYFIQTTPLYFNQNKSFWRNYWIFFIENWNFAINGKHKKDHNISNINCFSLSVSTNKSALKTKKTKPNLILSKYENWKSNVKKVGTELKCCNTTEIKCQTINR